MSIEYKIKHLNSIIDKTKNIPLSNGGRFYNKRKLKIGIISDEYFYNSIKDSASFIYLTCKNWEQVITNGIDLLFFETPWTGIDNEWEGIAWTGGNEKKDVLVKIVKTCKLKNIPTLFYSKEDPPDFYTFLEQARLFDYVFTTCEECIDSYKKELKHNNVFALPFCFNPIFNNPIGLSTEEQLDKVLFAGAWYEAFSERCTDQKMIFDGVLSSKGEKLFIIDRNYNHKKPSIFPKCYHSFIYPSVQHDVLQKLHKLFRWAINVNSIKDSKTMFANRTFELLANGNLILSNYSLGVNDILPNIFIIPNKEVVPMILDTLTNEEKYELQIAGVRSVMSTHTCFHRLEQFLEPLGLSQPVKEASILVVLEDEGCLRNFEYQTYKNKSYTLSRDLNVELVSKYDMVTWFTSKYEYDIFYLEDLCNSFKYTCSSFITKNKVKNSSRFSGAENSYTNEMKSKYITVFWVKDFDPNFLLDIKGEHILENGYSSDCLNISTNGE